MPSATEWTLLFDIAKKHALVGIAFAGVNRMRGDGDFGSSIGVPKVLYLKWLGLTARIQRRNLELNAECVMLCRQLAHDGFMSCILKGQSNLAYYPDHLREARTAGDIDVLMRSADRPVAIDIPIRYCLEQAAMRGKRTHVTYHHADLIWSGQTEVESHYRATFLCSPLRNWRLQRWLEENAPFNLCDAETIQKCSFDSAQDRRSPLCKKEGKNQGDTSTDGPDPSVDKSKEIPDLSLSRGNEGGFPIPTVSFNAIYQLLHIYKHLFEGGIGLRQLLDYYFVLRALHIEQGSFSDRTDSMAQWAEGMGIAVKSNKEIMHTLSRFGMKKFAGAVMYVLQKVFAMPSAYLLCEPNEKEGRFLLDEIMRAGNFGKYDDRLEHNSSTVGHAWEKLKRNMWFLTHYPEEVICEPFFRVYHWIWRKLELWRY